MMNLTHEQAREWIEKSLQSSLDPFEQEALEAHLVGCVECARCRADARALDRRLSQTLPERWPSPRLTPADIDHRLARIRSHLWRETMWKSISTAGRFAGAAALLIVIIAGLALLTRQFAPRPSPGGQVVPPAGTLETAPVTPTIEPLGTQPAGSSPTPGAAASGRLAVEEAEKLVKDFEFAGTPDMNPAATFPLSEITPADAWERMGVQVFKVTEGVRLAESYLIYQGQVAHIGNAFGGTGINSMAVTDLDQDGMPELVYAYNFGSGIHQSSMGMVSMQDGQISVQNAADSQSTGDFNFRGDLSLVKVDDRTLLVDIAPGGQYETSTMGRLFRINRQLLWTPDRSDLALYTSPDSGVSFQYPSVLQQVGQSQRYEGAGYFFEIAMLQSGSSDLKRSCEWEANYSGPYGDRPHVEMRLIGGHEVCLIHTSLNTKQAQDAIIFLSQDQKLVILRSDPAHQRLLAQTLVFAWEASQVPQEPVTLTVEPASTPVLAARQLGDLTLEEYAVVSASVDTPSHMEFHQRIPAEIFAKRAAWRDFNWQGRLDDNNRLLAPFGYRLEAMKSADGQDRADLYLGDTLVTGSLAYVYPASAYQDETGQGDFAMIVEDSSYKQWLVRKDSLSEWDSTAHRFALPILANGGRLIDVVRDVSQDEMGHELSYMYDVVLVQQDGQTVFTYAVAASPVTELVKGLWEWQGGWVLEINGTLIVDGANWNQKEIGADEIFGFQMIAGKPFFFFKRDGTIGMWYDGLELPVTYDDVIHYRCCEPAAFNPRTSPSMAAFFALREGVWYYVELGRYQ